MFKWLITLYQNWQHKRIMKKRLAEIRKKDPFIYD